MQVSAHLGEELRAKVDKLANTWRLTHSEAMRRLVVLGLGGTIQDGDELNKELGNWRTQMLKYYNYDGPRPVGREVNTSTPRLKTRIRLPKYVADQVTEAGGLRAVVARGVQKLGSL